MQVLELIHVLVNPTLSDFREISARFPRVSIVGVGEDGNGMVSRIFENGGSGAQCIAVDTDAEPLKQIRAHERVTVPAQFVGEDAGWERPETWEETVREYSKLMIPVLAGADVAFIVSKMRDDRAARVAPLVADMARRLGALTVGVAVMPASSERHDRAVSYHGVASLRRSCHTVAITDPGRPIQSPMYPPDACSGGADQLVVDMVSGLAETLACPSTVNIDPVAFRELTTHGGIAHVGIAYSSSALRVEEATVGALRGPLLYDNIMRTRGVLLNLRGDLNLTLEEAEAASRLVVERVGSDIPLVMGARTDDSLPDGLQVSVLLTGGAYPYIPGGYRRLPLEMYEMEPEGEDEGQLDLELELDQLE